MAKKQESYNEAMDKLRLIVASLYDSCFLAMIYIFDLLFYMICPCALPSENRISILSPA